MLECDVFEHGCVGFMFSKFGFESDGIVDAHGEAIPLQFPWLEWLGAPKCPLIVLGEFGIHIFGGAYESAVHTVDENVDNFFHIRVSVFAWRLMPLIRVSVNPSLSLEVGYNAEKMISFV